MNKFATAALLIGVCAAAAGTTGPIQMTDAQMAKFVGGFNLVVDLSAISAQDRLVIVESKPVNNPSRIGAAGCSRLYSGQAAVTPWSC
jgi:hypothetical protein